MRRGEEIKKARKKIAAKKKARREKEKRQSKKLEASFNKIDDLFLKCFEHSITPSLKKQERGAGWAISTMITYSDMLKAFTKDYFMEYGVADIRKMDDPNKVNQLIQKRIDLYHDGKTSEAFNLKTLVAALAAFNHGIKNTKIFNEPFEIGDIEEIRESMKEQHVVRKSSTSHVLRATPQDCQTVLENIKNTGYNVQSREIAYHSSKISMLTGGRLSSILKLTADDITVDPKTNEISFVSDKGGLTRTVKIDRDTSIYLQELKSGLKGNQRLFSSTRQDGTFKPVSETRKEVSKIIRNAARHLDRTEKHIIKGPSGEKKTVDVSKKFTHHSFRKAFALNRAAYYLKKFDSKTAMNRYVARRIEEDPMLKEKLDNLRDRINNQRTQDRNLTPQELAIFFTSKDLGHFRVDVITGYYTSYKEVERYIENTDDRG